MTAQRAAHVGKALTAAATGIGEALALGLLDGPAEKGALITLAVLGVYGVWRVPNAATPPA